MSTTPAQIARSERSARKVLRDAEIERNKRPLAKMPSDSPVDDSLRKELEALARDQTLPAADRDALAGFIVHIPSTIPYTPSERGRAWELIQRLRSRNVPAGMTSTTTPAGIAANDADALSPMQTTEIVSRKKASDPDAGQVVNIGLELLHPHPDNRHCGMGPDLAELADSIAVEQLQPITVRVAPPHWGLPEGHYQIVFGERRWLASKQAGLQAVKGIIRTDLDDAQTLELIAIENGQRKDLNPIEKARLVEKLCRPKDQRGSGLSREQAAQRVGLETAAGASNLVRLLELPKVWQDRVAGGELPESFARIVLQYVGAPMLLDQMNADYVKAHKAKSEWARRDWNRREELKRHLEWMADHHTRPIDGKTKVSYQHEQIGHWGSYPRLFELTDQVRKQLDIRTVTIDGKDIERTTNVKLFDKLNIAAIKAKKVQSQAGASKGKSSKPKSPEQAAKAAAAEKAKARAELDKSVAVWRHNWLKSLLAEELSDNPDLEGRLALYLLAFDENYAVGSVAPDRVIAATAKVKLPPRESWQALLQVGTDKLLPCLSAIVLAVLEAPEPRGRGVDYTDLPAEFIEALVQGESVDLAACWGALQRTKDRRLTEFFELHAGELLDDLGQELGVFLGMAKSRAAKLKLLAGKYPKLPLPNVLKRVDAKKPKAKGRR